MMGYGGCNKSVKGTEKVYQVKNLKNIIHYIFSTKELKNNLKF
jgi:hypothetical protein